MSYLDVIDAVTIFTSDITPIVEKFVTEDNYFNIMLAIDTLADEADEAKRQGYGENFKYCSKFKHKLKGIMYFTDNMQCEEGYLGGDITNYDDLYNSMAKKYYVTEDGRIMIGCYKRPEKDRYAHDILHEPSTIDPETKKMYDDMISVYSKASPEFLDRFNHEDNALKKVYHITKHSITFFTVNYISDRIISTISKLFPEMNFRVESMAVRPYFIYEELTEGYLRSCDAELEFRAFRNGIKLSEYDCQSRKKVTNRHANRVYINMLLASNTLDRYECITCKSDTCYGECSNESIKRDLKWDILRGRHVESNEQFNQIFVERVVDVDRKGN